MLPVACGDTGVGCEVAVTKQREAEAFLGRLVTDAQMRRAFFCDLDRSLPSQAYDVGPRVIDALRGLGEEPLAVFAATMDRSILRAAIVEVAAPVTQELKI